MTAEPNPKLVEAMQRLAGVTPAATPTEGSPPPSVRQTASSDDVAATVKACLDCIDELLADDTIPRGTRMNLTALRPVMATFAAVTLRWEELLSTAVVELRSPLTSEERQQARTEFANALLSMMPSEAERRLLAERLVAMVQTLLADHIAQANAVMRAAMAAIPQQKEQEAAQLKIEEAAKKGATAAVNREMGIFQAAVARHTKSQMKNPFVLAGVFIVGLLVGMVLSREWVSYAIREAAQVQAQPPPRR